jgi:tetratricopeptide (TPR) repeat protein
MLLAQYRSMAREDLERLLQFDTPAEAKFQLRILRASHDEVSRRLGRTARRLSRFRERELAGFLASDLLKPELFGGSGEMDPRLRRAVAYQFIGIHEKALTTLHEIVAVGRADAEVYYRMGASYAAIGKRAPAREAYLRAVEMDDAHAGALDALAGLALKRGDFRSAIEYLKRSLEAEPENVWALMTLSRIYGKLGRYPAAAALLRRVLEIEPENEDAQAELSLYARPGRPAPPKAPAPR